MSVGPKVSDKKLPKIKSGKAIKVVKDTTIGADSYSDRIVTETKLNKFSSKINQWVNDQVIPFFGTSRFIRRDGKFPQIYHSETHEFISPFTRKGMQTSGRLLVSMALHAIDSVSKARVNNVRTYNARRTASQSSITLTRGVHYCRRDFNGARPFSSRGCTARYRRCCRSNAVTS